jgi:hypothetical protein
MSKCPKITGTMFEKIYKNFPNLKKIDLSDNDWVNNMLI